MLITVKEIVQTDISRGSKSRNKVSVGEPAEGSLRNKMSARISLIIAYGESVGSRVDEESS